MNYLSLNASKDVLVKLNLPKTSLLWVASISFLIFENRTLRQAQGSNSKSKIQLLGIVTALLNKIGLQPLFVLIFAVVKVEK